RRPVEEDVHDVADLLDVGPDVGPRRHEGHVGPRGTVVAPHPGPGGARARGREHRPPRAVREPRLRLRLLAGVPGERDARCRERGRGVRSRGRGVGLGGGRGRRLPREADEPLGRGDLDLHEVLLARPRVDRGGGRRDVAVVVVRRDHRPARRALAHAQDRVELAARGGERDRPGRRGGPGPPQRARDDARRPGSAVRLREVRGDVLPDGTPDDASLGRDVADDVVRRGHGRGGPPPAGLGRGDEDAHAQGGGDQRGARPSVAPLGSGVNGHDDLPVVCARTLSEGNSARPPGARTTSDRTTVTALDGSASGQVHPREGYWTSPRGPYLTVCWSVAGAHVFRRRMGRFQMREPRASDDGRTAGGGTDGVLVADRAATPVERFSPSALTYAYDAARGTFAHQYDRDLQLVVLWSDARPHEAEVLEILRRELVVLAEIEVRWSPDEVVTNFERLYGQELWGTSPKPEQVGAGPFLLVVVEDPDPRYGYRSNVTGYVELTNLAVARAKAAARSLVGGYRIHSSNNIREFFHDATLLLGEDRLRSVLAHTGDEPYREVVSDDVVGSGGWRDLAELFGVLRLTSEYVVLRNAEDLPVAL